MCGQPTGAIVTSNGVMQLGLFHQSGPELHQLQHPVRAGPPKHRVPRHFVVAVCFCPYGTAPAGLAQHSSPVRAGAASAGRPLLI